MDEPEVILLFCALTSGIKQIINKDKRRKGIFMSLVLIIQFIKVFLLPFN